RGLIPKTDRKIWCFLGDGETDEPESLGAIGLAGRERLDNLIFVINCNLQRLDGPVRGNGKIIQELEGQFRGAGWNVLKLIWGSYWDPLLARDKDGKLKRLMMETVDGEYQACKAFGGAYTREHFFGKHPETKAMVASLSDADIWRLNRGGHDPHKVYAAYHAAMQGAGMPTVILAKTVKGYGMGDAGESQNITHQQKKMDTTAVRAFRDRFNIPIADDKVDEVPYYHPGPIRPRSNTCARAAKRWAARCPAAAARPIMHWPHRVWMRSSRSPKAPASARSAPPWPSCAASTCCCATRTSARASCRSWPTRRAPSAWRACSARSASTLHSARSTARRTPTN
ncbi:pyruvate dehydrogenase subunit E1, partial [mine drainage metagenome]